MKRIGQVAVYLDIQGTSVQQETNFDKTEYKLRYRFPVRYDVLDDRGKVLWSETTAASWNNGMRTGTGGSTVSSTGGTTQWTHHFGKFEPPANGQVQVKIKVDPDQTHGAKVQVAELHLYDNVSKQAGRIGGALFACCSGPVLLVAGLVILIIGLARGRTP